MFPASSFSIYFHALIIKSFFNELYIDLFVKDDMPGNSIRRLLESSFHKVAAFFLSSIISSRFLSPNIL